GTFQIGLDGGGIVLAGKDLGGGQNVLWKGISTSRPDASLEVRNCAIRHARVAVDLSGFDFLDGATTFALIQNVAFENNLSGVRPLKNGAGAQVLSCRFLNNSIGIEGSYVLFDSLAGNRNMIVDNSTFRNNQTAISNQNVSMTDCLLDENDTAIVHSPYSVFQRNTFSNNTYGISTLSAFFDSCSFDANERGLILLSFDPSRDRRILPTVIELC